MVLGLWGLDELKASKPCESREPIYRLGVEQPLLHWLGLSTIILGLGLSSV